ncbi:unnamed protein product [Macrosiphum euphorbiae]|uniref:Uncharacterized protein n=1 Tax=Macrosiphum euphorbiae TaxID=13131 RepID=A0AAV0WYW3_9HEMI|nr:unnamed protein product [Macrosiphum euphorbiae]
MVRRILPAERPAVGTSDHLRLLQYPKSLSTYRCSLSFTDFSLPVQVRSSSTTRYASPPSNYTAATL